MNRKIGLMVALVVMLVMQTDALLGVDYTQVDISTQANWSWSAYETPPATSRAASSFLVHLRVQRFSVAYHSTLPQIKRVNRLGMH